MYILDNIH